MILKTFWAHRKQNGWLLVEIALITVLSFYFIDHSVVMGYDTYICRASGDFEKKHLVTGHVGHLTDGPTPTDSTSIFGPLYALRDHIRKLPEVQSVCMSNSFIGDHSQEWTTMELYAEADTMRRCKAYLHQFLVGEHYFETHGLTAITGSPSIEMLSEECPEDGVIITRSLARAIFDTDQAVGRRIVLVTYNPRSNSRDEKETRHRKVAGVVEDVKAVPSQRYFYSIFTPTTLWDNSPMFLIRLKPDADAKAFVAQHDQKRDVIQEGTTVLVQLKTFKDYEGEVTNITGKNIMMNIIGLFLGLFLVNVVIGTLGTYWLQIRKRTEDFGIMRSFGAKRRNILGIVWKEVALLTLVACIIGQLLWLQIALQAGFANGLNEIKTGRETDWVSTFWLHFLIICIIQYLLMLVIVTLGIIIPALIAMYRKPVNALRHE